VTKPGIGIAERNVGRTLVWSIDNPDRKNAIKATALRWIGERAPTLAGETVILIGEENFCAGFDLTQLDVVRGDPLPDAVLIEATHAMRNADATFIAAITGHAIGAGVELACACDFRIATANARFRVPAGRLGVVYHARGLAAMVATLGVGPTRRMVLAGAELSARTLADAGALDEWIAEDELLDRALQLAARLEEQAPLSLAGNRTLLRALTEDALPPDLLDAHERVRALAYASEDHAEARAALTDRRPPRFRGR
jgi:enoyl-CoA hydratase/carnithine racemase